MHFKWITQLFDCASIILVFMAITLLFFQPALINPQFDDITYHLMVAEHFKKSGGPVLWDYWESLPTGRAHLYPPLFHVIIAPWINSTAERIDLLLPIALIAIASILLLTWIGTRLLFNARVAFLCIIILLSVSQYVTLLGTIIPASLVIAATPLLLYLLKHQKKVGAIALLTLMLYCHMIIPWIIVGSLVLWSIFNRSYAKTVASVIGISIAFYLPWLGHILINLDFIKYLNTDYNQLEKPWTLILDTAVIVFFFASIVYLWRTKIIQQKAVITFFLITWCASLPILFYKYPSRFSFSIGFFIMALFIAIGADQLLKNKRTVVRGIVLLLFIVISFFSIRITLTNQTSQKIHFSIEKSFWYNHLTLQDDKDTAWIVERKNYNEESAREIARLIVKHSAPDEVIYGASYTFNSLTRTPDQPGLITQIFGALSNRAISNLRSPERYWLTPLPIEEARIVVADFDQSNRDDATLKKITDEQFTLIGKINRLSIYSNNQETTYRIVPSRAVLPLPIAWVCIIIAIGIIGQQAYTTARKSTVALRSSVDHLRPAQK